MERDGDGTVREEEGDDNDDESWLKKRKKERQADSETLKFVVAFYFCWVFLLCPCFLIAFGSSIYLLHVDYVRFDHVSHVPLIEYLSNDGGCNI